MEFIALALGTNLFLKKFLDVDTGEVLAKVNPGANLEDLLEVLKEVILHLLLNINGVRSVLGKGMVKTFWLSVLTNLAVILDKSNTYLPQLSW